MDSETPNEILRGLEGRHQRVRAEEQTVLSEGRQRAMTPSEKPTGDFVRDLLGDPDANVLDLNDLTWNQKVGFALGRIARDVEGIRVNGCSHRDSDLERIRKLEQFVRVVKSVPVVLGSAAVVVGFVFLVIEFVRSWVVKGG